LFGRDVQFLVVLSVLPRQAAYRKVVEPVETNGVRGVEISDGDEKSHIYFNPAGTPFQIGGVASDGEKVVVKLQGGQPVGSGVVRGGNLSFGGRDLPV